MKILYAITTYDGYAYVDLSLTLHKKFGNDVIVIDDGSLSEKLNEVCLKHNVPLFNFANNSAKKFDNGDLVSTTLAIQYAYSHGYDYVVKHSRRFVFTENPTPSLIKLIEQSEASTYSTPWRISWGNWGFTTMCVAYKTSIWIKTIKQIFRQMKTKSDFGLIEHYIHVLSIINKPNTQKYNNYLKNHPQKSDQDGYIIWDFININKRPHQIIWHWTNKEQDYYQLSKKIGLNYTLKDYQIIDSHQQHIHKKRPYL